MAISLVAVGAKIAAATLNALINAANAIGLSIVVPSSVAGTGVTATSTGAVTFTNATTASLNGVFSSLYDNYRIEFVSAGASATQSFALALRSGGTDSTTLNYDGTMEYANSSTPGAVTLTSKGNWQLGASNPMTDYQTTIEVARPALAALTLIQGIAVGYSSAAAPLLSTYSGGHRLASSFDGFTITWGAAMSGSVRVYGYNNG